MDRLCNECAHRFYVHTWANKIIDDYYGTDNYKIVSRNDVINLPEPQKGSIIFSKVI